jgi:hypothetical protein
LNFDFAFGRHLAMKKNLMPLIIIVLLMAFNAPVLFKFISLKLIYVFKTSFWLAYREWTLQIGKASLGKQKELGVWIQENESKFHFHLLPAL